MYMYFEASTSSKQCGLLPRTMTIHSFSRPFQPFILLPLLHLVLIFLE